MSCDLHFALVKCSTELAVEEWIQLYVASLAELEGFDALALSIAVLGDPRAWSGDRSSQRDNSS